MLNVFFETDTIQRPTLLGTSFSQLQCRYLNIDYKQCVIDVCNLPFDAIRIAAYWDEIEQREGEYNFEILDFIVNELEKTKLAIIVSVGIKTPRWPEFHIPNYLKQKYDTKKSSIAIDGYEEIATKAYAYVEKTVQRYKDVKNVKYFLIENEGLNNAMFTHGKYISYAFVRSEAELVRSIKRPDQKIMCNNAIEMWPPWKQDGRFVDQSIEIADAIGINVYTKVPISDTWYAEPSFLYWLKLNRWKKTILNHGREAWITESQAEPWELHNGKGSAVHIEKVEYPSSNPYRSVKLASRLSKIGFPNVLMWGCEHWFWHKKNGRPEWWNTVNSFGLSEITR